MDVHGNDERKRTKDFKYVIFVFKIIIFFNNWVYNITDFLRSG